tara:strand:+ start:2511 stop:2939 length:429 start_codon:yes stop_codon:yes gene_type:complete
MKYNLKNDFDKERFKKRVNFLYENERVVILQEMTKRTLKQNNYLHLILTAFALETGYTLECVKRNFFKLEVNKDLFLTEEKGNFGTKQSLRSTSQITKENLSIGIDRFKKWSSDNGIYLPDAEDEEYLAHLEIEASRLQRYI